MLHFNCFCDIFNKQSETWQNMTETVLDYLQLCILNDIVITSITLNNFEKVAVLKKSYCFYFKTTPHSNSPLCKEKL